MKLVVFLLVAQLVTSCVSLTNGADTLNLGDLSDSSIKRLFKKYSHNETYMRFSDFEDFLGKIIHTIDDMDVHDHSHDGHSHDDHSHNDHSHDDHSRDERSHDDDDNHSHANSTITYERKFDSECFEDRLLKLKKLTSANKESIEKGDFAKLSSIFVSDLDLCIKETAVRKGNEVFDFGTAINFRRESKTVY